jgi:hypothetical protein
VSATVNPNSVDNAFTPTLWKLQYSRNGADWSTVSSGSINIANTTPVVVSGVATGLSPNTTYRVRVVTQKPLGNPEIASAESSFLTDATKPEVRTTATQSVSPSAATVSARINPHGTSTSYRFEWGEEGAINRAVPVPDAALGSGPDFVSVSQELVGLKPSTTYQYRAVAISASEGVTVGPTVAFTTPAQSVGEAGARAYELVSPADKTGGSGVGTWYAGVASHSSAGVPAYVGDRFGSISSYGGTLSEGGFAYGTDATLGERTQAGWVNRTAFNRPGGIQSAEFTKLPRLAFASDDLSLTAWSGNSQMRIFQGQAEAFPTFDPDGYVVREWDSGRWEVVAPFAAAQQTGGGGAVTGRRIAPNGGYALAAGQLRGVGGLNDPTHPSFNGDPSDLVCPPSPDTCRGNVYIDDVTAGLSDTFPGAGIRSLVNVCTGSGLDRTAIPSVDGGGKIGPGQCPQPASGRPARLVSPRGASVSLNGALPGQISADGSRVFFMSPDHAIAANLAPCSGSGVDAQCPPQLYVRQRDANGDFTVRWISQSTVTGQDASLMAPVIFEGATRDGDKVFFRTSSPLTPDDPNGGAQVPGGWTTGLPSAQSIDLYMYDLPDGPDGDPSTPDADPAGGVLTRVSAGPGGNGDGNVLTGPVASGDRSLRAMGDDGSRVYFTTAAPLAGVPASTNGTSTEPGGSTSQTTTKNLYLYDASRAVAERWSFVSNLPADSPLGRCASCKNRPGCSRSAGVGG